MALESRKDFLAVLKTQILFLVKDIQTFIPESKYTLWLLVKNFFNEMSEEELMDHIIKSVVPYKSQIMKKDETFFLNNKTIFGELPSEEVDYVRNMVGKEGILEDEDKEGFWNYFKVFITLAEEYKKKV